MERALSATDRTHALRRRGLWGRLLALIIALAVIDGAVSLVLLRRATVEYGSDRAPGRAGPAAAVIFYTSLEPFKTERLERALALYRAGTVDRLLFVGGYRPRRTFVGAEQEAGRAAAALGRADVVAADGGSYDTLSNMAAICALRAAIAPGRNLILVSDALHLKRIWEDRSVIGCVGEDAIGLAPSATSAGFAERMLIINKDMISRGVRAIVGEETYRRLVREWRFRQAQLAPPAVGLASHRPFG